MTEEKVIPVVSTLSSPFEVDASSLIKKPICLWQGTYHSPVTKALWEARSSINPAYANNAPAQRELLTKTPSESRTSIVYNFSMDFILREEYRDPWNGVRIGKLLEDLDALAGTIAVKHCSDKCILTRPLLLVTASVDKMVLRKPLHVDVDLSMSGAVTWVGRSSIDIQLEVSQNPPDRSHASDAVAFTANFTFVARDSKTGMSAAVYQISPESEQEKMLWEEAEAKDKARKMKRGEKKREIENMEGERLKALLAEGRILCDMPALATRDSILLRDTCHGRIFGGFLMHKAFELAYSTAYAFAGLVPSFLEVEHVDFLRPVDVGDFLRFKSCVLYTELDNPLQPLINIEVVAHVTKPELRTSEVSNSFHFTFSVRNLHTIENGFSIRSVVPATEEEARRILKHIDADK
ncbi:acyl-coenzyme A thioesterase 9, mitochondrial-like [Papaver somniferum]|uniref:acyl-coenzyme A thioesterase 9, mitochondrial-like n=1 Tax=Papaver somniferum TaxID=3469 RepID=UPI000E70105C|nr:acyl-coenzyme A thioesterase 9, mitochondrial-like [Papaver somniferum]